MTPEQRSAHMSKIRSKDTKPELKLRQVLHAAGYRYRLHDRRLPGRPDLVFPSRKKVIFVHGCFWHGHACPIGTRLPKTNRDFWAEKRQKNQDRDRRQKEELNNLGWDVFTLWECEITESGDFIEEVTRFLGTRRV
ncbi:very short patch repair endonuclease [Pseudarthrobacter sp. SLBN-100]